MSVEVSGISLYPNYTSYINSYNVKISPSDHGNVELRFNVNTHAYIVSLLNHTYVLKKPLKKQTVIIFDLPCRKFGSSILAQQYKAPIWAP